MLQQQHSNNEQEQQQSANNSTNPHESESVSKTVAADVQNIAQNTSQHVASTNMNVVAETDLVSNASTLPTVHPFFITNGKIKLQCRNLLLRSKFQSYQLYDETRFQQHVTLCQRISGTILELELKTHKFEFTTPNFYNLEINESHPVLYQLTRFELIFHNPIAGDLLLELKKGEFVIIPLILTLSNRRFFFDIQVKVDETGVIDTNIESRIPFGKPNSDCVLHFSQMATRTNDNQLF